MSFANFVHLCYIFPHDYSNWQRPSVQTQTGSKVQGRKLELTQAHFIDHDFLLKNLVWDGHETRGYILIQFLLDALWGLPDPQTSFEILFWMCRESTANIQKTRFHQSVKQQEETCKGSNMSFIQLTWSWYVWVYVCVCFLRSPCKSKSNYVWLDSPWPLKWELSKICWFFCFQMNMILWWFPFIPFFGLKDTWHGQTTSVTSLPNLWTHPYPHSI